ncbi:hypothetical protein [Alicyclobacillus sendaiensis]|uniref:hypothetical protein n=1 Tax=Alicyclobacillus sendaiensis TaxID=192387 RepID=UPI000A7519AA|nr:hypothetical protein [Alicyclobacillus sendaiensis]
MSRTAKLRLLTGVLACGIFCLLYFEIKNMLETSELPDGIYPLVNINVQPLPSVVYDPEGQVWWFDVNDGNQPDSVEYDADQVQVEITNGPREVVVTNQGNNVRVYLHKGDEITLGHGGVASAVVGAGTSKPSRTT